MRLIPLTQGLFAQVDDEDFERVSQHKWHVHRVNENLIYAKRNVFRDGKWTTERLHTFISGVKGVDHRDRNGLNNQRENLRAATPSQNGYNHIKHRHNTSGFKGVWRDRAAWTASLTLNSQRVYLGRFPTREEAAQAYDTAARQLHGEFALTNNL